MSFFMMGEIHL